MQPSKFFNLMLGFEIYKELRTISQKTEKSIAEIIRTAIDNYLQNLPGTQVRK